MRPAPLVTPESAFFWEAARDGRLVVQACGACGHLRHPPRPMCPQCRSLDVDEVELSGRGTVYSAVAVHYPQHPAYDYPVYAGIVALDEGIRLVAGFACDSLDDVPIGTAVEATFAPVADGWLIPMFRPR